jgi:phosphatidylserine/phosphatidylglycerophosphate/cardiolipin synthase-like enzyme
MDGILLAFRLSMAAAAAGGFELVSTRPVEAPLKLESLRQARDVWPEMFRSARSTIDIAQFYASPRPGEPLDACLDALREAGRRGVRIRFLAEKKFEPQSAQGLRALRSIPNCEARTIDFSALRGGGIHHAKYFVVDGTAAFLGSQNFDWRSLKHNHEMGLRITDPEVVGQMAAVFARDWSLQPLAAAGKRAPPLSRRPRPPAGRRAALVASPWSLNPPGVGDSEAELVRLIGDARRDIAVEVMEYSPLTRRGRFYPPIDNALREAACRGVRIRLLVSRRSLRFPAAEHLTSLNLVPGIQVRAAALPESSSGPIPFARVIHSKFMVVDSKVLWLGTSNWSGGYLDGSRNLEVIVRDEALASRARREHSILWDSACSTPLEALRR